MIYLICIGAVLLAGLIAVLWASHEAPRGEEDEYGFHASEDPKLPRTALSPPEAARAKRKSRRGLVS